MTDEPASSYVYEYIATDAFAHRVICSPACSLGNKEAIEWLKYIHDMPVSRGLIAESQYRWCGLTVICFEMECEAAIFMLSARSGLGAEDEDVTGDG
jgi:hypothetical protein